MLQQGFFRIRPLCYNSLNTRIALPERRKAIMPPSRQPVTSRVLRPAAAEGALDNPLKGWAAYSEDWNQHALPARMAYFSVSWRELEPERGRYRFAKWEQSRWESRNA